MHTVAETAAFVRQAKEEGMTEAERAEAVKIVAANPTVGDLIVGSGGCRKVRIPGRGRGKSGGYRVVTAYLGDDLPVVLIAVLYKGSRSNFSDAEVNAMAAAMKRLAEGYRKVAG